MLPVVRGAGRRGSPVSIDTMRAESAEAALEAGACLVNDVSGGLADQRCADAGRRLRVPYVLMHWRGPAREMYAAGRLRRRGPRGVARAAGAARGRRRRRRRPGAASSSIPGLGFAKKAEHNWALLAAPRPARRARARRCSSGRRASVSSAGCWPTPTVRLGHWTGARRRNGRGVCPGRPRGGLVRPRPRRPRHPRRGQGCRCLASGPGPMTSGLDRVALRGLSGRGRPRRLAHETRAAARCSSSTLVLHLDTRAAAPADDLADTVDYGRGRPARCCRPRRVSRCACSRRWPSGWPTSAWPIRASSRSRSPCTSRRPDAGVRVSTTSTVRDPRGAERERPAGRARPRRQPRGPGWQRCARLFADLGADGVAWSPAPRSTRPRRGGRSSSRRTSTRSPSSATTLDAAGWLPARTS